ncbi:peptide chain release factor N(5)-glutamine methyltransferase [Lunatibacter salilacus]|uniref:peptide chain release factor N(5)-glutamine methyltransferase n=1 Tax=Lunatibacter salilacus TaxID=2483804 RepID=UPI00131D4FD4|nr:peptide chain release factor N(5)-glutamine methyltransferase [Lunatibacter salilacus]
MNSKSSRALFKNYTQKLQDLYATDEAISQVQWLFEHFLMIYRKDLLLDKKITAIPEGLEFAMSKLLSGTPIQYVLGKAHFYGRDFFVSPHVLIPRFETEELVHLIIGENTFDAPNILDVGTGSGCIPITLWLEIPQSKVTGIDISPEAIAVASQNAGTLNATVDFLQVDILQDEIPTGPWDIIVSNPPYVRNLEKEAMHQNVLDHEPALALFVSDEDPLLFYRVITQKSTRNLNAGGKLYFEINEGFGPETKLLLEQKGFVDVTIHRDLQGKNRMVRGTWLG